MPLRVRDFSKVSNDACVFRGTDNVYEIKADENINKVNRWTNFGQNFEIQYKTLCKGGVRNSVMGVMELTCILV